MPSAPVPIDHNRPTTVIFGCGYVGSRLARALLAEGWPVRACARRLERLRPLEALGAELFPIDATRSKQFGPALRGLLTPYVVYSIPPPPGIPGGEAVRRAAQASLAGGARRFVYLGSTGLYGNTPDDDWVDEDTAVQLGDVDMSSRHQDEAAVQSATSAGLHTVVLRLTAIYGPGRGVRKRLRDGTYKLIDGGEHYISRVHVDDIVQAVRAALERAPQGSVYLVGDDRPTKQREYAAWLCDRLGVPMPASVASLAPGAPRTYLRGRRAQRPHEARARRDAPLPLVRRGRGPDRGRGARRRRRRGRHDGSDGSDDGGCSGGDGGDGGPGGGRAGGGAAAPIVLRLDDVPVLAGGGEGATAVADVAAALGVGGVGVRRVVLSPGGSAPLPAAREGDALCLVLAGAAAALVDGARHPLVAGDALGLPRGALATLQNDGEQPAILLVVEGPPR